MSGADPRRINLSIGFSAPYGNLSSMEAIYGSALLCVQENKKVETNEAPPH
jgi:hypothetical protein